MKRILFFVLLISVSLEQGILKKSRRSKHGEDCISDAACEEGLFCKINRCYTKYEISNLYQLGLLEKNLCDIKKKCKANEICIKHRCIDKDTPIHHPINRTRDIDDVNLIFAGGIYLNAKPYLSGIKSDNTVNYDHLFTHITREIKNADLAIVPQETPFFINEEGQKLVKNAKNTPKELGDAIVNAGFKVVLNACSTIYTHKEKGITDTINFWKTKYPDIHILGISSTLEESENDYFIYTKNNIKIGIINYSAFVGSNIPKKSKYMVNIISKNKVEETVEKIKSQVDFIVVCINWGDKTSLTPNKIQIKWAKELASLGVNLIIGNYPVNTQPVTLVKAENGNTALVFFSLGVLVGDNGKKTSALGALANIVISKAGDKTYISSYSLIPTLNHKSGDIYTVYELSDYDEDYGKEIDKKFSLQKLKKDCKKVMGAFAHCG